MSSGSIVLYIFILLIVVGLNVFVIYSHKGLIRESLEQRQAKVIRIAWQPFDFDKSNHTYMVEYEDAQGKPMSRQCKIHFWGSTIYWEE